MVTSCSWHVHRHVHDVLVEQIDDFKQFRDHEEPPQSAKLYTF